MTRNAHILILTARVRRFHPYADELRDAGYTVELPRRPDDLADELLRSADRWDGVIVDTELPFEPAFHDPSRLPDEQLRQQMLGILFYQRLRAVHPTKSLWLWASSREIGTRHKDIDGRVTMIHGYRALPAELVTYLDGYFNYTVRPNCTRARAY